MGPETVPLRPLRPRYTNFPQKYPPHTPSMDYSYGNITTAAAHLQHWHGPCGRRDAPPATTASLHALSSRNVAYHGALLPAPPAARCKVDARIKLQVSARCRRRRRPV